MMIITITVISVGGIPLTSKLEFYAQSTNAVISGRPTDKIYYKLSYYDHMISYCDLDLEDSK